MITVPTVPAWVSDDIFEDAPDSGDAAFVGWLADDEPQTINEIIGWDGPDFSYLFERAA